LKSDVNAVTHNGLGHGFCSDQSLALTTNCLATSWTLRKFHFEISFAWTWLHSKTCCITSNVTSARTEPVCGSLFQPVNDCVAWRIEKYALKNTPRMNMFVHREFYECNAGCMQGVNARMHVVCRLHASCIRSYAGCIRSYAGCTLHASVMWTRLNRTQTTSLRGSALYKYINWNLTECFVCCALFTGHQCADAIGWSPGWISRRAVQLGRRQHRHHAGQKARHSPSRFPDSSVLQCLFLLDVWRRFFEAPQQNSHFLLATYVLTNAI